MHLIVVGLSHKTAPIEVREKLAVPASRLGEALHRLCVYPAVKEGFLLSTCNRVEVYAVSIASWRIHIWRSPRIN
jgi:glutamyl-tRNA reductase